MLDGRILLRLGNTLLYLCDRKHAWLQGHPRASVGQSLSASVRMDVRSGSTTGIQPTRPKRQLPGSRRQWIGHAIQADVADVEQVEQMRDQVHDTFGQVEVLVNNAGINQDVRFTEMSHEEWDTVLDVHLDGAFHCTQAFFDDLAANGRLINISSIIGKGGNFGQANYATAKAGIFGFTRTIALELATDKYAIPDDRLHPDRHG